MRQSRNNSLVNAIIEARKGSRDFVLGIFVDLYDFCKKLEKRLRTQMLTPNAGGALVTACQALRTAIETKECVIANQIGLNEEREKQEEHSRHLDLFPLLLLKTTETELWERLLGTDQTGGVVNVPFVKGTHLNLSKGTHLNLSKGTHLNLSKGTHHQPVQERRHRGTYSENSRARSRLCGSQGR